MAIFGRENLIKKDYNFQINNSLSTKSSDEDFNLNSS